MTEVDFFHTCPPPPLSGSNGGIIRLLLCLQTAVRRSLSIMARGRPQAGETSVSRHLFHRGTSPLCGAKKAKQRFHACFQRPRARTSTRLKRPWEHFQHWITTPTVTFRHFLQFYHFHCVFFLALGTSRVAPPPSRPTPGADPGAVFYQRSRLSV